MKPIKNDENNCKRLSIRIKGYNNIADFCYRKLKKNDKVFINGKIETDVVLYIKNITKIY